MKLNETISVDHADCGDTKSRLFYSRKKRLVVFYCHNCAHKGKMTHAQFLRLGLTNTRKRTSRIADRDTWVHNPLLWPGDAYNWVAQYGITVDEMRKHKLAFDPDGHRVVLPYCKGTSVRGYQFRAILPGVKPKYLTCRIAEGGSYFSTDGTFDKVILTEDMLSAIRCGRHGTGVALLGTHVNTKLLSDLVLRGAKEVYIFLDNDNREVCKNQVRAKDSIEAVLDIPVTIIRTDRDPKEHTDDELSLIFNGEAHG